MKKLSREQIREKILKLDKFERVSEYDWSVYIDGTGFKYNSRTNTWWKLMGPYIYTYPLPSDFYEKIINKTCEYITPKASSIDEVLETVPNDIRDSILFNLNLFR